MDTSRLQVACFAPPLTDAMMAAYRKIGVELPEGEVKEEFACLIKCVDAWLALPNSTRTDGQKFSIRHLGVDKIITVTPLETAQVAALDSVTPWMRELDTLSNERDTGLFDNLTGDVRNAAFHLLWISKELTLDREPLTQDVLISA